jgi:hypothetical protein
MGSYKKVTVAGCNDKPYILYPRATTPPELGAGYKYFGVPLNSVAVTQTIPMTFLENLGVREKIKFISQFSVSGCAQKLVSDGSAAVYSSADKATQAASVEAVIVSSVAGGEWGWNDEASEHKLICDKSSSEPTLLAGAECIKFWALFFDKPTEAAASHCETEARYTCNSVAASSISAASSHMTSNYMYQTPTAVFMSTESWNNAHVIYTTPYKVALIQDAGSVMPDLSAFSAYYIAASSKYSFDYTNTAALAAFHSAIQNVDVIVAETYPHHMDWATLHTTFTTASAAMMPKAFTNGDVYTLDATMNGGGCPRGTHSLESPNS